MRKLGVLLVLSILLFVFGCGTFVYELSQISPNQIDLSQETQTMTTTMPLFSAFICITMPAGLGIYVRLAMYVSLWMRWWKIINYRIIHW